jgi:hypothetical protein
MKTIRLFFAVVLGWSVTVAAQDPALSSPATTPAELSSAQLEELLGPVALYPDALIALILPASTIPADLVLAARELRTRGNTLPDVESRAWDDSVKSLARYPEVVFWLDENLDWTNQVGEAFLTQPAAVMNAVQRLRTRARAAGSLVDTPQQQVLATAEGIRIVPAQPEVIYVPQYEPAVVYVASTTAFSPPPLAFGFGFPVGSWLAYDMDWRQRKVWVGNRHRHWQRHDWRRPLVSPDHRYSSPTPVRYWQPPVRPARIGSRATYTLHPPVHRPRPISGVRNPPRPGPHAATTHTHSATATSRLPHNRNLPPAFAPGSGTAHSHAHPVSPGSRPAPSRHTSTATYQQYQSQLWVPQPTPRLLPSTVPGTGPFQPVRSVPLTVPSQSTARPLDPPPAVDSHRRHPHRGTVTNSGTDGTVFPAAPRHSAGRPGSHRTPERTALAHPGDRAGPRGRSPAHRAR